MGTTALAALVCLICLLASAAAQTQPPPGAPNLLTVQFIIRDVVGQGSTGVNKTTHPDFERANAAETGMVAYRLGADRKPVFNSSRVSTTVTNATTYSWFFNDRTGVNIRLTRNFNMTWNTQTGLYEYSNQAFFPIDNAGYGNWNGGSRNFHFCLEYHTQFAFQGTEKFTFAGDDDVWFFVNNQLFIDLGGVHGTQSASRDLSSASLATQYGLVKGSVYNFDLFYCERHTSGSTIQIATNILLNNCPFLDPCGFCTPTAPPAGALSPCLTMACGNGLCSCPNASCICNAGWINGPAGNCSQNCGDGILQGSEQCDPPGPCCTAQCAFAARGSTCPSLGQPCIQNICPGNNATCGVPLPVGSLCNRTGLVAPQCQQYQCTLADGSTCALTNNNTLACSDNNACTTDVCSAGACLSTTVPCQPSLCRLAGTCSATSGNCSLGTPRPDGTGCGPDPGVTVCVQPTCVSGSCTNTPKPANTPCGGLTANGCGTSVCDGSGACRVVAVANAQGTVASCTQPVDPNACFTNVCSGTGCVALNKADRTACTSATLTITSPSCQTFGCVNGSCAILPVNEGQVCTDATPTLNTFGNDACSKKVCQAGACVKTIDTAKDTVACNVGAGANPEPVCRTYQCKSGVCGATFVNESQTCATAPDSCTASVCQSGACTNVSANIGGQCKADTNNGCTYYRCDASRNCVARQQTSGALCNSTDLCFPGYCNASGSCVTAPVTCVGCGAPACTAGQCAVTNDACCGNGKLDGRNEECDDPADPCCVACKYAAVGATCGTNECNRQTCQLKPGFASLNTTCVSDTASRENAACTSVPAPTNQCLQNVCRSGTCSTVNKADDTPCLLTTDGFCNKPVCRTGTCTLVANATSAGANCTGVYGGAVPECNTPKCGTLQCVLTPFNVGGTCSSLPAKSCADRFCSALGSCTYSVTAFPLGTACTGVTSATACLVPGCDGAGNCVLLPAPAATACSRPFNPTCSDPVCDGTGNCTLRAKNIGTACVTARDAQCQVSSCDVNGLCVVSNVTNGTPCSRGDVGQCQDSVCQGGVCALTNTPDLTRSCTPPPAGIDRSCFVYTCQADGSCNTPTNKPDATPCGADLGLSFCITPTCVSGVCTNTSKAANVPCGGLSADGCGTSVCDGLGACVLAAVPNAQGNQVSCTQPTAGSCFTNVCSGTGCAALNKADATACINATAAALITSPTCQVLGCTGAACVVLNRNEGLACADGAPLSSFGDPSCQAKICRAGACVAVPDSAKDDTNCNVGAGANPEPVCRTYQCKSGVCGATFVNESQTCATAPDSCTASVCQSGACTNVSANIGGQCKADTNNGCTYYRCDASRNCVANFAQVDLSCDASNLCSPKFCDASGACVAQPVVCSGCGSPVCQAASGKCATTTNGCCGNSKVDSAQEECDDPTDPCCVACKYAAVGATCGTNECDRQTCQLKPSVASLNTTCVSDTASREDAACTSAASPTNQCLELRCRSGTCSAVNRADQSACALGGVGFCGTAVCLSGACTVVPKAAVANATCPYANLPECNAPICTGTDCVLVDANTGGACTSLPATECASRLCAGGSCDYDYTAFPLGTACTGVTSASACLVPGCDGAGNCVLLPAPAATACSRPFNPTCSTPQCDGTGNCTLSPLNIGAACVTARDAQCQASSCDVNGLCSVANVTDGTPCSRGDVGQCQDSQCQGGACVLIATPDLTRSCTPPPAGIDRSCFVYTCQADGSCNTPTNKPDATPCGADLGLSFCITPTCVSGVCTNTSKAANVPCGGLSADGCGTSVCDGLGACVLAAVPNAQGNQVSCTQPAPDACTTSVCSGSGCTPLAKPDATACANASLTLTSASCQAFGCQGGVCGIVAINEGQVCTDATPTLNTFGNDACSKKVCQAGACVKVQDPTKDDINCNVGAGANPEPVCRTYQCKSGVCGATFVNESQTCATAPDSCTASVCQSGACTNVSANIGGQCKADANSGCTYYRCDASRNCVANFAVANLSCDPTDLCSPRFCDASGACVAQPVVCSGCGSPVCQAATGQCVKTGAGCCGNGKVDGPGEECDDPFDPCCVACKYAAVGATCGTAECQVLTCQPIAASANTTCTADTASLAGSPCSSLPAPTNQCVQNVCRGGTCTSESRPDSSPCVLGTDGFCTQATCLSGTCTLIPDPANAGADCSASYGAPVPECDVAVCTGLQCTLTPANTGNTCVALPAGDCRAPQCGTTGSCEYSYTSFPSGTPCTSTISSSACLVPGCDGVGNCVLLPSVSGIPCDLPSNPECNEPVCDGLGNCTLRAKNIGQACNTARDSQCQVSSCDVNGLCSVSNVVDGAPCTRTDTGQCDDSVCVSGACVLQVTTQVRLCTPALDPTADRSCLDFYCQPSGACDVPTNKPNGVNCTDANLCDSDTCKDGVCVHAPAVLCDAPTLPCQVPVGTCQGAFGNCTYSGKGQYALCSPLASELDPRCNASVAGAYRCSSGAADSPCVPVCFSGGVCGDGIINGDEECDWGDARTGGPCCDVNTCKWFADDTACVDADADAAALTASLAANFSRDLGLPVKCFTQRCVRDPLSHASVCTLALNTTVDKSCSSSNNHRNNRIAITAAVVPSAILACCLGALAFFLWRRAQKAAESEWLQEFINAGEAHVVGNPAFTDPSLNVTNAVFQP